MRVGLSVGLDVGLACGTGATDGAVAPTWTIDATSGKGVPASSAEWATLISELAIGAAPSSLYLMQEASGNIADTIGAVPLTASGAGRSYANVISGWSRLALGTADGVAGSFGVASGVGPNMSTTSAAMLAYLRIDNATAERSLMAFSTTASDLVQVNVTATGIPRAYIDAGNTLGVTAHEGGAAIPVLLVYDRTNARARVYTNAEKILPVYGAVALDGEKFYGAASGGVANATSRFLYSCWWTGANAEWLSTDANAKSLLQKLGWTIPWS